jgi:FAD/FMN-containing dehydrogenase
VLVALPPAKLWTNWVGNQSFTPGHAAAPRDEQEVAALVRQAAQLGSRVRVAGAGHRSRRSSTGLLLDVSAL